ncbi:arylsulfatase [Rhodopirellula sp. SM50]|nr:arylsulfatase [Rhodopirellula sp. SM50]PAY16799.1 arylsulfatase [Rhodopirellula sp. SM50]
MKKLCLILVAAGFLLPAFCDASAQAQSLKGSRPNIVFVMTDDQGMGDLSCMGNEVVRTPNIDQLYQQSTRLTDYHVSPTCAPTRAALMSGRLPFMVGVTHTIQQRERMALDVVTMPQALKSAGYATGLFGKWHLGDDLPYLPQSRGFDEVLMHGAGGIGQVNFGDFAANKNNVYFDNVLLHNDTIVQTKGFCTDVFFQAGLNWIKEQKDSDSPYFAYISLNAPHAPLVAPKDYTEYFLNLGYDKGTAARYGMIENIDDNVGLLLKKLQEWGQLSDTFVIFTTDNGATHLSGTLNGERIKHFNYNMKGAKNSPNEGGTHVPAFLYWKGVLSEGVDIDQLIHHVDLFPTFVELAGAELPETMQPLDGRSILPLLANKEADWPDRERFVHCGRWAKGKRDEGKYQKTAVRTERWRLVNHEELYDITNDPSETTDVASAKPDVVARLRQAFDQWWDSALPMMVNEGLPSVKGPNQPFAIRYEKQLQEKGIPDWAPAESFLLTRALSGNTVSDSTAPQTKAAGDSAADTEPLTRIQKRARRKNKGKEQSSETSGLEEVPQQ